MNARPQPVRPSIRPAVNAGTTVPVDYAADRCASPIAAVRWRLDDLTCGRAVQGWVDLLDPENSGQIVIPAALNAMANDHVDRQLMQVTVHVTLEDESELVELVHYELCAVRRV